MDHRRIDPELLASLALDDELDHAELLQLLDAMADDESARAFWRAARGTDQILDGLRGVADERPVRTTTRRMPRRTAWIRAASAVAAILLIVVAVDRIRPTSPVPSDGPVQVRLEEAPDSMDDARFVELAVELLRADRRYHTEMADLLDDVHARAFVPESPTPVRRGERETRIARSEVGHDRHAPLSTTSSVPAAF